MKLTHLLAATAALALASGAAYAQTPNQSAPASAKDAKTGVPSIDATRPTGANAGKTNLPAGEVTGTVSSSTTTEPAPTEATASTESTTAATADTSGTTATSATSVGTGASVTTTMVSNGPVPDTAENRAKYGQPLSRAGKRTAARGN
jgi:hypothetical protein